jgi:hypothetical protein
MTRDELLRELHDRAQADANKDKLFNTQYYCGSAAAYRTAARLVRRLDTRARDKYLSELDRMLSKIPYEQCLQDRWHDGRRVGLKTAKAFAEDVLRDFSPAEGPRLHWRTGEAPQGEAVLYCVNDYSHGTFSSRCSVCHHLAHPDARWIPLSEILSLIDSPEEPDDFNIPGWDME